MSNFFSIDSPFYKFMSRLTDMLKLNVLWLLCSGVAGMFVIELVLAMAGLNAYRFLSFIPLITMGAATTAAFTITIKMIDEQEGYIAKAYFQAFKENFKKGNIIGWIFLIASYSIWLDFQFFHAAEKVHQNGMGYLILGVIAVFLAFTHLIYAFPLEARYENTIINTLRNSFSISVRYFVKTIILFVVVAVVTAFFFWSSVTQFLGILIGPATLILAISGSAVPIFRLIENDNEARGEQENSEEE